MKGKFSPRNLRGHATQRFLGDRAINLGGNGIVNLIDVGSAGLLPSPWRESTARIHHLLKFDPRDKPSTTRHVVSLRMALWEDNSERDFYIYAGSRGQGSSLFPVNHAYVTENFDDLRKQGPTRLVKTWFERSQLIRVERVTCRRLDDVLAELTDLPDYHFLKIDAQGAEHQILRGAERFLTESCLGLHLELFAIPIYKGIKLLPEVVAYLADFGFDLVEKYPPHGSFNSQHDCVFLKSNCEGEIVDTLREIYNLL